MTDAHVVSRLIRHESEHTLIDLVVHGPHGDKTITATDHHPVWVAEHGEQWTDATDVRVGDHPRAPDGTL